MKKYLIKKTIKYNGNIRTDYHSRCSVSDNLERSWKLAFADYEDCQLALENLQYWDAPYCEKGFEFEYEIIESL